MATKMEIWTFKSNKGSGKKKKKKTKLKEKC